MTIPDAIDLYEEIALALARRVTPEAYAARVLALPRNHSAAQQERLKALYTALRPLALQDWMVPVVYEAALMPVLNAFGTNAAWAAVTIFR